MLPAFGPVTAMERTSGPSGRISPSFFSSTSDCTAVLVGKLPVGVTGDHIGGDAGVGVESSSGSKRPSLKRVRSERAREVLISSSVISPNNKESCRWWEMLSQARSQPMRTARAADSAGPSVTLWWAWKSVTAPQSETT